MKNVLFLRRDGVYLPEITAYTNYIRTHLPTIQAYDSADLKHDITTSDFDVVWKFMGFDTGPKPKPFIIHEYGSLSVGLFPKVKNLIKRFANLPPSRRVFLNNDVKHDMGFTDSVPYRLRDMGVSLHFFRDHAPLNPEYDFVYSGSLNRGPVISKLFYHFKTKMKNARLLVVGTVPDHLHTAFGKTPNITFTGRLQYKDVPDAITRARYGLNIMPDIYPYNIQTATKVLEYCAAGMPVVTTRYPWIQSFESTSNARFFYTDTDFSNLDMTTIAQHPFVIPDMTMYQWDRILKQSKIFDFLGDL